MQSFTRIFPFLYLLLAIVGGSLTFYFILEGMHENHWLFDGLAFIKSTWTPDNYARSLTIDFWTGAVTGVLFMLAEGYRLKMKRVWMYVAITILIGFATGFPLFLYMRSVKMARQSS